MLLTLLLGCGASTASPALGGKPALIDCVVDQVVDIGMDGKADWRWRTTYDAAGRETHTASDQGNTGTATGGMNFHWDEHGNMVRREWDADGDGKADRTTTHVFDGGREVEELRDDNGDGVPDEIHHMQYVDDRLMQVDVVRQDASHPGSTIRYAYDEHGNRVLRVERDVGDPMPNSIRTWIYDRNGNAVREETDHTITGVPGIVQTTTYDVRGRPVETRWDTDMDGRTNNFAFWAYDCPGG